MKRKEPRWHAARGITIPNHDDSAAAVHLLAFLGPTEREASHVA